MSSFDCRRAEELFSDHREGSLDPVMQADLEAHLAGCAACRELRETLDDVLSALGGISVLEPPAGLAERAATAALARGRLSRRRAPPLVTPFRLPLGIQALAAGLAIVSSGVLLWTGKAAGPRLRTDRLVERTVNAGVYLVERKDRLMEDLRILRVVIGTAFEGRLDRMNDRVDDYRRLLERRRSVEEGQQKRSGGKEEESSELRSAKAPPHSLNLGGTGFVRRDVMGGGRSEVPKRDAEIDSNARSET